MREISFVVKDEIGIHARPAGLLVKEASKFKSDITINTKGKTADAKKLFSIMGLSAKTGDELKIKISGADEDNAEKELSYFLEKNL